MQTRCSQSCSLVVKVARCIAGCRSPNRGIASAGSSNGLDLARRRKVQGYVRRGKLNLEKESRTALLKPTQIVSANGLSRNRLLLIIILWSARAICPAPRCHRLPVYVFLFEYGHRAQLIQGVPRALPPQSVYHNFLIFNIMYFH